MSIWWICLKHGSTKERCDCEAPTTAYADAEIWCDVDVQKPFKPYVAPVFQKFWACAHHASAIDNFFGKREKCEHGCQDQQLLWYHAGQRPDPWARVRIGA